MTGEALPIALAIRQTLDAVAFSNPLPFWNEPLTIDFDTRESTMQGHIDRILGGTGLAPLFEIAVPRRSSAVTTWVVPSVDDQIALQTAVAAVAPDLERTLDRSRVFSYALNRDPASVALTRDQVESWQRFQDATSERVRSAGFMLQLDLLRAFDNLTRPKVLGFLETKLPSSRARDLLVRFLDLLPSRNGGLAYVNDSLFVVGNACLAQVDEVVARRTRNFIRFVDDYRIFGASRDELEALLQQIAKDIETAGFAVNVSKLKLGSAQDYFEAIAKPQYTPAGDVNDYIASRVFQDVVPADFMIALIDRVVSNVPQYLNDGFGRLVLSALRKMRMDGALADKMGAYGQLSDFRDHLQLEANSRIVDRLSSIAGADASPDSAWASVWATYVLHDAFDSKKSPAYRTLDELMHRHSAPMVIRLWAASAGRSLQNDKERKPLDIGVLHREGYLEAGLTAFGKDVGA